MKITIVCQFYWPDNFLVNEIAEDLVKRGNKVTVLTGLPDYATTKVPKEYRFFKRRHETHNGVEIIRVPIIARHKGFIFRVLNYMSFYINSSIYALTHKIDTDVIFAYQLAPILMINAGMIWKRRLKKPMFTYVLDLWPDQMKVWHVGENNPLFKIMLKYCKKAYNAGDIVGITSRPFKKYLTEICKVDENKIIYLPQHANKLEITNKNSKDNKTNFIFAGNIGEQQDIECILKAVKEIKTNKEYMVHIYGNGTSYEKLKELNKEYGLEDKIKFYGRVNKEELNEVYSRMDAFLLTLCSEEKIGYVANTVPAKLQGYMSAGKPIIAAINGGANEIIKESNCGIAVASGNYVGLAKAMKDYIENKDKYQECGKNAIDYFNKNFEKELVINKLEQILKELAHKE